jgi:hypothetical protein
MKKIKLSVAALLIAGMSYGQDIYRSDSVYVLSDYNVKVFKEIDMRINDIISSIRKDMFYGRIDDGMYYINEILKIKSRNEDLMSELFTKQIRTK